MSSFVCYVINLNMSVYDCSGWATRQGQDLPCTYPAHPDLDSLDAHVVLVFAQMIVVVSMKPILSIAI